MTPSSPRLGYRRLCRSDADAFHALCLDEHVSRYLLDGQRLSRQWALEIIDNSDSLFGAAGVGLWLVVNDGAAIGFCGYHRFDTLSAEPQLIYAFARPHVGRGYATEAGGAMLAEARRLGWPRVLAATDGPNQESRHVLDKLGFRCAGRVPGAFGDTLLFERWEGPPPRRLYAPVGTRFRLRIASTWEGEPAYENEIVCLELEVGDIELTVHTDAPFHGDEAPTSTMRLWEHEVVELMLLGDGERYVEVELSPHGEHLVLLFAGARNVVHRDLALDYHAEIDARAARWHGRARIPLSWLPADTRRLNAYAMHGDTMRRYLAWSATRGERPDFHRLSSFGSFDDDAIDVTWPSRQEDGASA